MGKAAELVGAVTTLAGLTLFGVSMGTMEWLLTSDLNFGLFTVCLVANPGRCFDTGFDISNATILIPKVLMLCAAGFLGVGLFFHLLSFCVGSKTRGCCLTAGATFYIFGALLTAAAPAVLLGFNQILVEFSATLQTFGSSLQIQSGFTYGYSFYLAWAAAALILFAAIIDCVAGCTTSEERVVPQQGVVWSTEQQQATVVLGDPAVAVTGQQNYYLPA